ncbi:hypothetical protein PVK06_048195 [Gossypium arboreum]|uniref:Uncharacterized protein n=1 Tax=Gossypium arboreum TaxID=29729 RepID=A0ABR0MFE1_GOSAR|nr:hypothetical protein PVK06_048195 [Gossypium arboreum]
MPRPSGPASTSSPPLEAPQTFPDMLEKQAIHIFHLFLKKLLFDDDKEDKEPTTTHKHTKEPAKYEEPIEFAHLDSDKEDNDRQHTFMPTTTAKVPQSKAPMTDQDHELTMSDIEDTDEMPINQVQQKRFKKVAKKTV